MEVYHIVKVQRPISTNDKHIPWMVYDQLRARMCHIPEKDVPAEVKEALGNDFKAFFEATWNEAKDSWDIGVKTHWRAW